MFNKRTWQIVVVGFLAVLMVAAAVMPMNAAGVGAVREPPVLAAQASVLRSTAVSGELQTRAPEHRDWLGLEPSVRDSTVELTLTFEPQDQTVGFWVLDEHGLRRFQSGVALRSVNIAAGNRSPLLPDNELHARFKATGHSKYTVVVYNDSNVPVTYTLRVEGGILVDESGQVTDVSVEEEAEETVQEVATPTPKPKEVAPPKAETPPQPAQPAVIRALALNGELPTSSTQHWLGLEPSVRDGTVTLTLTHEPQDQTVGFWVLDAHGLHRFLNRTPLRSVNIAAGNPASLLPANVLQARFKAVGDASYTVIVYSDSRAPITYTLRVDGGLLIDASSQTTPVDTGTP